jgi:hypothetical protein
VHAAYFDVRFRAPAPPLRWPTEFVVVTAWATTGEQWSAEESTAADERLARELLRRAVWHTRLTGYSPRTGHAEPGWAVELTLDEGCDVGRRYLQDAIYLVRGDDLSVTYCDDRREPVPVGRFRERIDLDTKSPQQP